MTQDLDREPTLEELAVEVKLSPKKVQETLDYAKKPTSLNRPLGDDGAGELGDLVANTLPESQAYIAFHETQKALNDLLDEVLGGLKDTRIVDVIKMRYGLFDGNVWLLDQVGEYFGCTREWARQLEKKGRDRLEAHVKAKGLSFSDFMD